MRGYALEVGKYYKSLLGEVFHIQDSVYGGSYSQYFIGSSADNTHKFDSRGRCSSKMYDDYLVEESNVNEFNKQKGKKYCGFDKFDLFKESSDEVYKRYSMIKDSDFE